MAPPTIPAARRRIGNRVFAALHGSSLVYNQCWEDPALDRQALGLGTRPDLRVVVITSAGCNALDYAIAGAGAVHAVDVNPRQNALLELKQQAVRHLDHEDAFRIFGEGRHPAFRRLYERHLRPGLSPFAQAWWDRRQGWFNGRGWRDSFYFHGLSGLVARLFRTWSRRDALLAAAIDELLVAPDLATQRKIYLDRVEERLFTPAFMWMCNRQKMMDLLGVPADQTEEVARTGVGGVAGFIRAAIRQVMCDLPIRDNYFWSVYLRGSYSRTCCPSYLSEIGFSQLRSGAVDRVHPFTGTVTAFLRQAPAPIDRFVLLDHMDWLGRHHRDLLAEEWAAIFAAAAPGARIIWRSAHPRPTFLDGLEAPGHGRVLERLRFDRATAERLHARDRVGTYGGFHIADLAA